MVVQVFGNLATHYKVLSRASPEEGVSQMGLLRKAVWRACKKMVCRDRPLRLSEVVTCPGLRAYPCEAQPRGWIYPIWAATGGRPYG